MRTSGAPATMPASHAWAGTVRNSAGGAAEELRSRRDSGSVPQRVRADYSRILSLGIVLSVAVHFAVFSLFHGFGIPGLAVESVTLASVELPPEVEIPPPPETVARPARPVVSTVEVSEEITIAPTTFEAHPAEGLGPPPPQVMASDPAERPQFIPYDTPPRLKNGREIERLLVSEYPPILRKAGLGGTVVMWLYLNISGTVERTLVKETSGNRLLDAAAERVATRMDFEPARNRDKPTAVWVSQAVTFHVK